MVGIRRVDRCDRSVHGNRLRGAYNAQDAYFERWALTPDQVGIDKTSALLRVTPLAMVGGLVSVVALAWVVVIGRWIHGQLSAKLRALIPLAVFIPLTVIGMIFVVVITNAIVHDPASDEALRVLNEDPNTSQLRGAAMEALVFWTAAAFVWVSLRWGFGEKVATLGATVAVAVPLGTWVNSWVGDATTHFPMPSARLSTVGIRPAFADVRWHDPARRPPQLGDATNENRLLVILSEVGGRYKLLDCFAHRIYTVTEAEADVDRVLPVVSPGQMKQWIIEHTGCHPQ